MKLLPSIFVFGGALALGAPGLWAQPASAPTSPASATAAAEWTLGFEASEGYTAGQSPAGSQVSILGGSATIISGGAAEGTQFVRFVPKNPDDALLIHLPPAVAAGGSRILTFAVRLPGGAQATRLVLSQGWTIALKPVPGGLEIETNEVPPRRVSLTLAEGSWLALGLREHGAAGTWDLLVAGQPTLTGLPLQPAAENLADLLIFSDGALDLDAVNVATEAQDLTAKVATGGGTSLKSQALSQADAAKRREATLIEALRLAMAGDLAGAEALAASVTEAEPGSAREHFDLAEALARLAYILHDASLFNHSSKLAESALGHLKQTDGKFAGDQSKYFATAGAYFAAQLEDDILGDAPHAQADFQRVLAIDPEFRAARDGLDRLQRKQGRQSPAQSTTKGGN